MSDASARGGGSRRVVLGPPPPPEPGARVEFFTGAAVNAFDEGEGPPVVLVHGLPGSAYEWGRLPELLIDSGFRVIRYDRVGYGHSSLRLGSGDPLRANALELAALCDKLALERPILLGFSYGGAIVQELLVARPGAARAVVLLASVGPAHALPRLAGRAQRRAMRLALATGVGAAGVVRQLGTPMWGGEPPGHWTRLNRALLALPGVVVTAFLEAEQLDPGALRPEAIGVPALVIHGVDDQTVKFDVGMDLMTSIPQAEFCEIPRACHMLPFTEPGPVAAAITTFATRLKPPEERENRGRPGPAAGGGLGEG